MTTVMPHDEARYREMKKRTKSEEDAAGSGGLPTAKLLLKGKAEKANIYRFQTRDLAFNKSNGRYKSEVLAWESQNGRSLDCFDPEDQKVLRDILLKIRPDENEKVKEDLRKNGQLNPGIVTCDGIVINGNRRKALLEELYEETGEQKFRYLEVHVLPPNITKRELWLIEAGIQLSASQQLDYSPINNLLKLREGVDAGLQPKEIATRVYGFTIGKLEEDLERLDLIDAYLRDLIDKEHCYYLAEGLNEHFIDLQTILDWVADPKGPRKIEWDYGKSDINDLKLVGFYYIRGKFTHMQIRELRDMFCLKEAWEETRKVLVEVSAKVPTATKENNEEAAKEPDETTTDTVDNGDEDLPEEEPPDAEVVVRHQREEKKWMQKHKGKLKGRYQNAKERVQVHQDKKAPLALAQRALRNLDAIDAKSVGFCNQDVLDALKKIHKLSGQLVRECGIRSRKGMKGHGRAKSRK